MCRSKSARGALTYTASLLQDKKTLKIQQACKHPRWFSFFVLIRPLFIFRDKARNTLMREITERFTNCSASREKLLNVLCMYCVYILCVCPVGCLFLCSCAESHTMLLFSLFPIDGHYISCRPQEEKVPMYAVHLTAACRDLFFCALCRVM